MFDSDSDVTTTLPAVALVLVFVLGGCLALPSDDPAPSDLEREITAADPPDEITATVDVRRTVDGETSQYTEDIWLRADGTSRIETTAGGTETVIVDDGDRRWHYDATHDWATRLETDPAAMSYLEGVYAQQARYLERYEITAVEETSLDGRDSYHVTFDTPANETIERSINVLIDDTEYVVPLATSERAPVKRAADHVEVWYDQETMFPVKHAVEGDGVTLERTYRNLSIEPGIDDDRFTFDPATDGNGTAVRDVVLPSIDSYDSLEAANRSVPFAVADLPTGAVPETIERDEIIRYEFPDENRTQVSVRYRMPNDESISVSTSDGPRRLAVGGDAVTLGTVTGTIAETDEATELQWACGDRYYSVVVSHAFEDGTALRIGKALSTDC
ncbi:LolA family protein [Natrinema altunense]|uniref:Outer membrane lipoprotein carrier protein LolA n=1 Tax=Natrinema altunense TaxID=222984 RepID=A0A482XXS1_9EURY|nr:outer membrane lipoprotein carrier protein LolA [Natrinema altunense]RZH68529.1 outer membrane lipoprotein carrier protein LolA [Natrinema altunense]